LERKEDIESLINRIDQLINVAKMIVDDLSEISRSLRILVEAGRPVAEAPSSLTEIEEAFSEDLRQMLEFEDLGDYVKISPKRFLGSDNFARIASIVRGLSGEYVSAGKESHFRAPKRR